jgi:DNA sulfur modification protein DndD
MIVEKIELENFMCYSGKNAFEFTEGINVIIGDNGYGKSQLYNAFYWVMYDQIFVKEADKFLNTKSLKSKIISDKAKAETNHGQLSAIVSITFHNLERDNVYILERKYTVDVTDGKMIENNDSEFTIMERELSYMNARLVNDEEKKQSIKTRILPPNLKPYLWFQGEQVESIIDFNKQDSLTQAINVLSNISRYDEIQNIANLASKAANSEYDRERRRLSKDRDKSLELENLKASLLRKIELLHKEEKELSDNLSIAEERCEILLSKTGDAQKINELKEKLKGIKNLIEEFNNRLKEDQISFFKKMFRNKWLLKGTGNIYEEYSEKFSNYQQKRLLRLAEIKAKQEIETKAEKELQTRLPFNVPEPNYVQWMLKEEKCLVCDREAKVGSVAWNKIKELIERPEKQNSKIELTTKQNFESDFKKLYQNGISLSDRIVNIDSDISETLQNRMALAAKIREENYKFKKVEDQIQALLSDTSLTLEGAGHILNEYSIQNTKAKDFNSRLNKVIQQIEFNKNSLRNVNDQLSALVTGEIPKWLIEKLEVLNDFEIIAKNTRERVFSSLINQLEQEANTHYEVMTLGNKSARGKIKLRQLPNGNYMPEIINSVGEPLSGYNTSNLILVKLATIMAIVSAKSSLGVVDFYTLITDAPTSVFGEDYTIGFCKTISKVYKQSIIMSKEFYKNQELRNELLTNPDIRIGVVYMITPSIPEKQRDNRNSLVTNIERLN